MKKRLSKLKRIGKKRIHFIDTPGHHEFIMKTMKGATQAEVAILMVDASQFDNHLDKGLIRKHLNLILGNDIREVIICINKMDLLKWSKVKFKYMVERLKKYFLKENVLLNVDKKYVPISGLSGENLCEKIMNDWYKGESLLGELVKIDKKFQDDELKKPLRMTVKNVFKGNSSRKKGFGLAVKIEGGILENHDKILLMPLNKVFMINSIYREDKKIPFAICGETVDVILKIKKEEDFEDISKGNVLCSPLHPIPFVIEFKAKIYTLKMNHPIIPGSRYLIHCGLQSVSGKFKKILKELDVKTESIKKKNPRLLNNKSLAIVQFQLDKRMCVENMINYSCYSKIQVSDEFRTVAYGKITELLN